MMHTRTDKSPAILPVSVYVGGHPGQSCAGDIKPRTHRVSRTLCDHSCPQFTDRKKQGRCVLQAIEVIPGEECSMLNKFLSGIESPIED